MLLAFLQLVTIVLAFGATVPTDLDATTSTESSRDYSSLLGIDDNYEDEAEGREPFNANGSGFSRGRSGYSALADVEEDGARPSVFDMEMDDLGVGKSRSLVGQIVSSAHTKLTHTRYLVQVLVPVLVRSCPAAARARTAHRVRSDRHDLARSAQIRFTGSGGTRGGRLERAGGRPRSELTRTRDEPSSQSVARQAL